MTLRCVRGRRGALLPDHITTVPRTRISWRSGLTLSGPVVRRPVSGEATGVTAISPGGRGPFTPTGGAQVLLSRRDRIAVRRRRDHAGLGRPVATTQDRVWPMWSLATSEGGGLCTALGPRDGRPVLPDGLP